MLPAGDSRMEWKLCLVGMGIDGQSQAMAAAPDCHGVRRGATEASAVCVRGLRLW